MYLTFTMRVLGRMYYIMYNVLTIFTMRVLGRMWVYYVFNIHYESIGKDVLHNV